MSKPHLRKRRFLGRGLAATPASGITTLAELVRRAKAEPLAVTSATRSSQLPEVPAVRETGLPGVKDFEAVGWLGLMAPKGTPAAIVERLNREVVDILKGESMVRFIRDKGSEPAPTAPAEFVRFIASEIPKWGRVVKASGATAE